MKIIKFLICLLFIISSTLTYAITPKDIAKKCKTYDKIIYWVRTNIWYKTDREVHNSFDYWQTSQETLKLRSGDCEDMAILMHDSLKHIGIESTVLAVAPKHKLEGHALCVFRRNSNIYGASNAPTIVILSSNKIEDICYQVYKDWEFYYTVDVNTVQYGDYRIEKKVYNENKK